MLKTVLIILCALPSIAQTTPEQARTLFEERKFEQLKALLTPVKSDQAGFAAAQYYLGRMALLEDKPDQAEDYLEEAVEKNGAVADYHYWLGATYGTIARDANVFRQGMLAPKIKNEFEKTIQLDPRHMSALLGLLSYYTEAPGFMGGSYSKAEEVALSISKINVAQGHQARAVIFSSQEKYVEAEKEYSEAVKADPQFTISLGNFYVNQKSYEKAFSLYEGILTKDPANMPATYQVGRTSAISGLRLARGEECLKKYLGYSPGRNEPSRAGALMRLGQVYEKKGDKPEARKMFEAALKLDGSLKEAKTGLARVSH